VSNPAAYLPDGWSMSAWQRALRRKRTFDIALSLLGLFGLLPVFMVLAALVRVSSAGPVFFVQERLGQYGTRFRMYKFRTMQVDAPDWRHPDGTTRTLARDPRVTSLGHLLRRSSLDELPQLLNVLLGQMSLVGPRPELPDGLARYDPCHLPRLAVPPGLTGWAAVHGRNELVLEERRRLDTWYAYHRSTWLDIRILFLTVRAVVTGRGVVSTRAAIQPPSSAQ
jgi:lipopolysaccharide/colanic/teichoic acid biosynthesis glycosyltransferase